VIAVVMAKAWQFDTIIDAAATVPPKVSITNQGRWSSKGALSARNNRAGHSHPNPVSRSRFKPCIRAIFLREFTLFAHAATYPGVELNRFLMRDPSTMNSGQDAGKNPVQEQQQVQHRAGRIVAWNVATVFDDIE
jgi:hypothetical protein